MKVLAKMFSFVVNEDGTINIILTVAKYLLILLFCYLMAVALTFLGRIPELWDAYWDSRFDNLWGQLSR